MECSGTPWVHAALDGLSARSQKGGLILLVEALGPARLVITSMGPNGAGVPDDIPSTVVTTVVNAAYRYSLGSDHEGVVAM